jgi:hypothetical protein
MKTLLTKRLCLTLVGKQIVKLRIVIMKKAHNFHLVMTFFLTKLTIYLNFSASFTAGGITYSFPKRASSEL